MADTKDYGNIAIKLKHDNTIKKNAALDNPAVHIERSGNDVVKRASELNVEKASDSASSKKREHKGEEGDGTITENAETKDVKKRKTEKKNMKTDKRNTKAGGEKNAAPGHEEQKN